MHTQLTHNGTGGRAYGGDPSLVHIPDHHRSDVGVIVANGLDDTMRLLGVLGVGHDPLPLDATNPLCPGCYMIALFDAAIVLAERYGQPVHELGSSMALLFTKLAAEGKYRATNAMGDLFKAADAARSRTPDKFFTKNEDQPNTMRVSDGVKYDGGLVSLYAEMSIDEFFAETFAALFCDHEKSEKETVKLMERLINVTYAQIEAVGEENLAPPDSIQGRLLNLTKIKAEIDGGTYRATEKDFEALIGTVLDAVINNKLPPEALGAFLGHDHAKH